MTGLWRWVVLALCGVLLGCGGGVVPLPRLSALSPRKATSPRDMVPVEACDAWLAAGREHARKIALEWIDTRRRVHERSCAGDASAELAEWGGPGCSGDDYCYGGDGYGYEFSDEPLAAGGFGTNDATIRTRPRASAEAVSSTNVQVAGVDEADIVKNDRQHVYVLGERALHIVRAWPPAEARVVSKTALTGKPLRLFVTEKHAVVFSSVRGALGPRTHVTVFDITDRAAPKKARELTVGGAYLAARMAGETVHTVVAQHRYPVLSRVGARAMPPSLCRSDIFASYDDIREDIVELIDGQPDSAWLPSVELATDGAKTTLVSCDLYRRDAEDFEVDGMTSVLSFDLAGGQPSMVTLQDAAEVIYASPRHLYIAVQVFADHLKALRAHPSTERDAISAIHRFRLAPGRAHYAGSSVVAGTLNDQFAMDEHEGHLRVASTGNQASHVSVLRDRDEKWEIGAWVGGIAPTETIRSVRFVEDRGYVVTFRQIDPLFAFDLTGGEVKLLGELKIPGYASYIHPLPHHRLLTVGFGSSDRERPEALDAVRLQLVDASVPSEPKLEHLEILGKRSTSEAQRDHLAFNYFEARQLLLLPIDVYRRGELDTRFAGVVAYGVDVEKGFTILGAVPSPEAATATRSIVMDDYVLMLAGKTLRIRQLSSLSREARTITLE